MNHLKTIYTIIIWSIYATMNAQYSTDNNNIIAEFKVMDARDNGEDVSPRMIPANGRLIIYQSAINNQLMLSNFWEKSQTQSYGPITCLSIELTPESEKTYKKEVVTFNWAYSNTFDDNKGIAESKILILYKPQGKYFELTILTEDKWLLVYKGEMKGNLRELDSYVE